MQQRTKISTAFTFFVSIATMFSSELSSLIEGKNVRLNRHTVFVRKNVTNAGGAVRIIDENTKKVDGISSLSETKLPKNHAVVFDKIAVGFKEDPNDNNEAGVDYVASKAPAIARNASIVITQNGREVLDLPLADLVKGVSPGSPEDFYHDLEGFFYLVDDQPMEWTLRLPNGKSLAPETAAQFVYMEVRLQGFKTIRKQ